MKYIQVETHEGVITLGIHGMLMTKQPDESGYYRLSILLPTGKYFMISKSKEHNEILKRYTRTFEYMTLNDIIPYSKWYGNDLEVHSNRTHMYQDLPTKAIQ